MLLIIGIIVPICYQFIQLRNQNIASDCRSQIHFLLPKFVKPFIFYVDIQYENNSVIGIARTFYNIPIYQVNFRTPEDCSAGTRAIIKSL